MIDRFCFALWYMLLFLFVGFAGFVYGSVYKYSYKQLSNATAPLHLSNEILLSNAEFHKKIYPQDIVLHILPLDVFRKQAKDPNILAFARIDVKPCEISIPDTWTISFVPTKAKAHWDFDTNDRLYNSHMGDTLAHEILHCQWGDWHQEFDKVMAVK